MTQPRSGTTGTTRNSTSSTSGNGRKQKNGRTGFSPGDVLIADVPFTEGNRRKVRPVVVLSSSDHNLVRRDIVTAKISGSEASGFWEMDIDRWAQFGLQKPSKVVCDHLISVSKTSVRRVGRLDFRTAVGIRRTVKTLLGL
jgi:mRNA interferase MazF